MSNVFAIRKNFSDYQVLDLELTNITQHLPVPGLGAVIGGVLCHIIFWLFGKAAVAFIRCRHRVYLQCLKEE